jgi:hypothetical protein
MNSDSVRPITPVPARKVFDVSRPGRAQPNSTSKPVIVGHRPVVSDPAVTMNGIGARPMMNPHKKISIMSHDDMPARSTPAAEPQPPAPIPPQIPSTPPAELNQIRTHSAATFQQPAPASPSALSPALVAAATAAPAPPKPGVMPWALPSAKPTPASPAAADSDMAEHASAPAIPVDSTADDATPDDDLLAAMPAPSVDQPETTPMVSRQVGSKEFPWKWIILIVIIIILAVAIADILLDADFLSWGVPHTHFF